MRSNLGIKKIHFMGIGGDGISGTAFLSHKLGFVVDGCDNSSWGKNYSDPLLREGIAVRDRHDITHLVDTDLIVCSNAMFYQEKPSDEFLIAKKQNKLVRWTEFLSDHIIKEKQSIFICGSHGKTTTTTLIAKIFEKAGMDPSVIVGETIREWGRNFRYGKSDLFILECDEKFFVDYSPRILILNNMDYEHPEFFKNKKNFYLAYETFIRRIREYGTIVFNYDDKKILGVIIRNLSLLKGLKIKLIAYSISKTVVTEKNIKDDILFYYGRSNGTSPDSQLVINNQLSIWCGLRGEHNVMNMLGAYAISKEFSVPDAVVGSVFLDTPFLKRRVEPVYTSDDVHVYDDFAHHPTEILFTLKTLKDLFIGANIIAIFEPHQITRLKRFWNKFVRTLGLADKIIFLPIFVGREPDKAVPDLAKMIDSIDMSGHKFVYAKNFEIAFNEAIFGLKMGVKNVIVVMGAAKSSTVTQMIKGYFSSR